MLGAILVLVALANAGEPPADAEVLRALPPANRNLPGVVGEFRADVVIVKSLLGWKAIGPWATLPGAGPAWMVETRWECAAHYTRTVELGFPFAVTLKRHCVQVVYIDKHALRADAKK